MTEQSAFSKKNIQATAAVEKRGLLEELNLPPQLAVFIRKNSRNLLITACVVVVAMLAWAGYDYYAGLQRDRAASLLASAMREKEDGKRLPLLVELQEKYGRTSAATWSLVEMAHIDYRNKRFDEALAKYEKILDGVARDNALFPLLVYRIAQTHEQKGDNAQAIKSYQILVDIPGFSREAYLALGRIYEAANEPAKAREVYEKELAALTDGASDNQPPGELTALIENKLARLKSSTAGKEKPEEGAGAGAR